MEAPVHTIKDAFILTNFWEKASSIYISHRIVYSGTFEMKQKKHETLDESLVLILKKCQRRSSLAVREILKILSGKGRALFLLILSLPICQPIHIPGVSVPFGITIAILGLQMTLGKRLWLPKKILAKTISAARLKKIVRWFLHIKRKIRKIIRPRLKSLCRNHILNGLVLIFLGVFLALPLPIPFSNLVDGWSVFFIALGILESDGFLLLLGYLGSLLIVGLIITTVFSFMTLYPK